MDDYEQPPYIARRFNKLPSACTVMKQRSHEIIREIQGLGISSNDIYWELADRLNIPVERAHFSKIRDLLTLSKAITHLANIRNELLAK